MRVFRIALWGTGLVALGVAVVLLVVLKTRGGELATVAALAVAVLAAVPAVDGWIRQRRGRPDDAAEELVRQLRTWEAVALAQVLGDAGDPSPADVGFRVRDGLTHRSDGGSVAGSLRAPAEYFGALERGRLVVLGEAGAGKTVLLIQLALDLLGRHTTPPAEVRPVPVRMNLASFDPYADGRSADEIGDVGLAARFDSWLVGQLVRHGTGREAARRLVADRRVLPLLDGLDEMAGIDHAAAVVRALNFGARSRPFVLTSRAESFGEVMAVVRLRDASAVELEPLSPAAVRGYVIARLGAQAAESRWHRALASFEAANVGEQLWPTPFTDALGSPWRLYLCVTAFAEHGDPYTELSELSPVEVTGYLLERFIPELVAQYPHRRGEHWRPDDVTRWLRCMALTGERLRPETAEITLPALWPAAGRVQPRVVGGLCQAMLGWGIGAAVLYIQQPDVLDFDAPLWMKLGVVAFLILMTAATGLMAMGMPVLVSRISLPPWRTRSGRRLLLMGVLPWSLAGGAAMAGLMALFDQREALPAGIVSAAMLFLQLSSGRRPAALVRPSQIVRLSAEFDLLSALICFAGFGIIAYSAGAPVLPIAIMAAFVLARPTWFRYFAAVVLGRIGNRLPPRPARLLDWAYEVGLVRLSGSGVEFRHSELRSWLLVGDLPGSTAAAQSARRRSGRLG